MYYSQNPKRLERPERSVKNGICFNLRCQPGYKYTFSLTKIAVIM